MINAFYFMPFASRGKIFPEDRVIGIRFRYDPDVIEIIKDCLHDYRGPRSSIIDHERMIKTPGGWLQEYKAWFCEKNVWPDLKSRLKFAGYLVREDFKPLIPECFMLLELKPPVDRAEIKKAYRRKAMETHPDHGGDHSAFIAVQGAYEQALSYMGATHGL